MKKRIHKIVLIVLGLIHSLIFFLMPLINFNIPEEYMEEFLEELTDFSNEFGGLLGLEEVAKIPKITGMFIIKVLNMVKSMLEGVMDGFGGLGGLALGLSDLGAEEMQDFNSAVLLVTLCLLVPVVLGIISSVVNLIFNGKKSDIASIVLAVLSAPSYIMMFMGAKQVSDLTQLGVIVGEEPYISVAVLTFVLAAVTIIGQVAASVVGLIQTETGYSSDVFDDGPVGGGAIAGGGFVDRVMDGIIIGLTGSYRDAEIPVENGMTIVIGRDPRESNIVVKGKDVSRKHCSVSFDGNSGMYTLIDYSTFGTYYANGERVPAGVPISIAAGTVISITKDGERFRLG